MASVSVAIDLLKNDSSFTACVTHWEKIPAREGRYADFPRELKDDLVSILKKRGIDRLYSHQAGAYEAVRRGRDIVVVTPTASGKTLCYNLPVLQDLLEHPEYRALYLFPTKALSQDQQSELNEVILGGEVPVKVFTYDGDTPSSVRVSARDNGRIVITNPDMLHTGILPNHPKWIKFLSSLKYVVIDEVHIYRGVFGSHMTNLVRRLKRIASFYGSNPQFICCSATIGNPLDLASRILESEPVLIDDNGSPGGEKHMIFYNPPLVDAVQGIRRGVVHESQRLAVKLLRAGIKTIVFARSRIRTELIASYINGTLRNVYTDNERIRVEPYRGGYLPSERRQIEKGLRDGSIHGVVSTNALELGIDIGGLDAAILAGFPGSIASTWQQAGRSGRRNTLSVAICIASASPTDQFLIRHPEYFFGTSPESAFIDPDNLFILLDQLKCAVFEIPFKSGDVFGQDTQALLAHLEENGVIRHAGDSWFWADRSYPSEQVSLRSSTPENVVIINSTKGKFDVIGEMDRVSAMELLFEGAVYIHRGEQFLVTKLDLENSKCLVEEADLNYFTDAIVKSDIKVLHRDGEQEQAGQTTIIGDVLVRREVAKYKKIKYQTHENIGYGEIYLPEEEMHTRSAILVFSKGTRAGEAFEEVDLALREEVLQRIGTLVKNVAPVFLLCEPSDIGIAERLRDPYTDAPSIYVYDMYPGGTGLSETLLEKVDLIFGACLELVERCGCERGCPSCIGPDLEQRRPEDNRKRAVLGFLYGICGGKGK
ncbi:MAG: DEAD/DEAH box helicase [Spirochaetales bacterium]|nr:DEAD/DEAH box helicase [Spirochaetales bacterium]